MKRYLPLLPILVALAGYCVVATSTAIGSAFAVDSGASRRLAARVSNQGRELRIHLRAPRGETCSGFLLVSLRPRNAAAAAQAQQLQAYSSVRLVVGDLQHIRRRSTRSRSFSIYINSSVACSNGKKFRDCVRVIVPATARRKGFSLKEWLNAARTGVAAILATTPIPTATATPVAPLPFPPTSLSMQQAFNGISFSSPVDLQDPGDGSGRLFVVEQGGRIRVFQNSQQVSSSALFLDISGRISNGGERGLLGLAFDSQYASNGFFYVNYTRQGDGATIISRFRVSANANQADSASEFILLTIAQPFANHNGGALQFGPDGYLYAALGDGGSGGDPQGNGQSLTTLLGKILRIDVRTPSGGRNYGIPADNPFFGSTSARQEIFAYGFRNPWRIGFDPPTSRLWAGDVGQGAREEIDLVASGRNYGWNRMEGSICFPSNATCNTSGLELPIAEYDHSRGVSVTGGYVYRGTAVPSLAGVYLYGDFGSGRIWGIRGLAPLEQAELLDTSLSISSFGRDSAGEVYIVDYGSGKIQRFQQ